MPRIEVDDRGSSGIARLYRMLLIISVFAYIVAPFLDDAITIGGLSAAGTLNTEQLGMAIRVSLAVHGAQFLFHILACTVGVGMVIWQAQREDSSTFFLAPAGTAMAIGISAVAGRFMPQPDVGVVNEAMLRALEGTDMHQLAMNFGMIGIVEYAGITAVFLALSGLGLGIKSRHDAQDASKESARGQKPEGWGET